MKNIIILLLVGFFLNFSNSYAQLATNDAAANAQLLAIKSSNTKNYIKNSAILVEAKNTLTTLKNMKKTYDEWSKSVRVVNEYIKSGKEIINISKIIDKIQNEYVDILKIISYEDALSFDQKEVYVSVFSKILLRSLDHLERGIDITSSGTFEMNDSERLLMLGDIQNKITENQNLMLYAIKKLKYAIGKAKAMNANNNQLLETVTAVKQ